jgi:phage terminase small subunit
MPPKKAPPPPKSLDKPGRKEWARGHELFDITDTHHLRLWEHACRMVDLAEAARQTLDEVGLFYNDRFGCPKEHPAAQVERQSMNAYRMACRELGFDLVEGAVAPKSHPRTGKRN